MIPCPVVWDMSRLKKLAHWQRIIKIKTMKTYTMFCGPCVVHCYCSLHSPTFKKSKRIVFISWKAEAMSRYSRNQKTYSKWPLHFISIRQSNQPCNRCRKTFPLVKHCQSAICQALTQQRSRNKDKNHNDAQHFRVSTREIVTDSKGTCLLWQKPAKMTKQQKEPKHHQCPLNILPSHTKLQLYCEHSPACTHKIPRRERATGCTDKLDSKTRRVLLIHIQKEGLSGAEWLNRIDIVPSSPLGKRKIIWCFFVSSPVIGAEPAN